MCPNIFVHFHFLQVQVQWTCPDTFVHFNFLSECFFFFNFPTFLSISTLSDSISLGPRIRRLLLIFYFLSRHFTHTCTPTHPCNAILSMNHMARRQPVSYRLVLAISCRSALQPCRPYRQRLHDFHLPAEERGRRGRFGLVGWVVLFILEIVTHVSATGLVASYTQYCRYKKKKTCMGVKTILVRECV